MSRWTMLPSNNLDDACSESAGMSGRILTPYSLLDVLVSVRIQPDIQWEYCYHTMIRHRVEAIPRSALDCNQS